MSDRGKIRATVGLAAVAVVLVLKIPALGQTARIETINPKNGKVLLQREGRMGFRPISGPSPLNLGDQLFPSGGVRVTVICPDLQKRPVRAGVPSGLKSICPFWEARGARGAQAPGTLGGINRSIPYLIAPRHTLLLGNKPTLRWNAVEGATSYTVQIASPTGVIWEQQVKEAQVVYPGQPSLEPGVFYSVMVQTNTGQSSQEDETSNLAFIALHPAQAEIVNTEAAKLVRQKFSELNTALLLANLYSNYVLPDTALSAYGLTSQTSRTYNLTEGAIAILETLVQQGERSPIIYRSLGDLYWQTGLANLAAKHYLQTIELAEFPEDLEERTLAQFGLGEISAATDDSKQAISWYEQARMGYVSLGDTQQADFLKQQIENLKL